MVSPTGPGSPRERLAELELRIGADETAERCERLLEGGGAACDPELLTWLTSAADPGAWPAYWSRVWGARGLLYVWSESAAPAVVAGLTDGAWRVAEMCLKVAARREIGEAGPGAVLLLDHDLPRVRAQAARCLGIVGDTEHVEAVRDLLHDDRDDVRRAAARALELLGERLDLD